MEKLFSDKPLATPDGRFGFIVGLGLGMIAALAFVLETCKVKV